VSDAAAPLPSRSPSAADAGAPTVVVDVAEEDEARRRFAFGLERLVFFSDAVFAIAITLLAIDIRLPELPDGVTDAGVRDAILGLWPQLFAFALSFLVIAQFWIGHYRTFRYVEHVNGRLVAINLALLFCVALLPFPTSVVAQVGDRPSGAVLYAGFITVAGTVSTLLWAYPMVIAGLSGGRVSPDLAGRITKRASVIPVMFGLSIPVALVAPGYAWILWVGALVVQEVVTRALGIHGPLEVASRQG